MNDETDFVHPAAAQWLTENGYQYEHEKWMPIRGRIDFYAWKENTQMLLECKLKFQGIDKAIAQILDYSKQFERPILSALALPRNMVTDSAVKYCEAHNVIVIRLPIALYRIRLDEATEKLVWNLAAKEQTAPGRIMRRLVMSHPLIRERKAKSE